MYEEIVNAVLEKEKTIHHSLNKGVYFVDGVGPLARVTQVLGVINFDNGALARWKNKMAKESFLKQVPLTGQISAQEAHSAFSKALAAGDTFATASANFGQLVHGWLEEFALTGKFPELKQDLYSDVFKVFESVKKFVADFGLGTQDVTVIRPELFVYNTLGYAGTADLVVLRKGKVYLLDYKVTNSLKLQYLLQLAAYAAAIKELYQLDVEKATLIRFDKKGNGYERVAVSKTQLDTYFQMFKMCLMFYRFVQNPSYASVKELNTDERIDFVTRGLLK